MQELKFYYFNEIFPVLKKVCRTIEGLLSPLPPRLQKKTNKRTNECISLILIPSLRHVAHWGSGSAAVSKFFSLPLHTWSQLSDGSSNRPALFLF